MERRSHGQQVEQLTGDIEIRSGHTSEALLWPFGWMRPLATALDYARRWIGTAFSFVLFGIGSVWLGAVAVPLVYMRVRDPQQRLVRVRALVGHAVRFFVGFIRAVGVLEYRYEGLEHARPGASYLIVANHPTLIDIVFLLARFPMADCVIKQRMARNPITRQIAQAAGYLSNDDPVTLLEDAVAGLKNGRSLILFPEGTRSDASGLMSFKPGAAAIAIRSGRNCLPILIRCEPLTLTRSTRWYQIPRRRALISISVQPPVSPARVLGDALHSRYARRRFNAWLQSYFEERLAASRF
ncbi:lysophospholipid acyltransferase family protein [soil metagenome]